MADSKLAQGTKADSAKPRLDLLDSQWLRDVAQVMTFGAEKYEAHNWRKGINWSRVIAAGMRHMAAINDGEDLDPETGKPHAAHLSCCAMFLNWYLTHRKEFDDRYATQERDKPGNGKLQYQGAQTVGLSSEASGCDSVG